MVVSFIFYPSVEHSCEIMRMDLSSLQVFCRAPPVVSITIWDKASGQFHYSVWAALQRSDGSQSRKRGDLDFRFRFEQSYRL